MKKIEVLLAYIEEYSIAVAARDQKTRGCCTGEPFHSKNTAAMIMRYTISNRFTHDFHQLVHETKFSL